MNEYSAVSGNLVSADGTVKNIVDLLGGGTAVNDKVYSPGEFGPRSGTVVGSDGKVYDLTQLLHSGGSGSTDQNTSNPALRKAQLRFYRYLENTTATSANGKELRSATLDMDDFRKLGSGLFIHWGVYSVPAGRYTGEKAPTATVTAQNISYNTEWSLRDLGIPLDVYRSYEEQFTGENFNPEAICQLAVDCGMKYIIITAKHHEGFTLYPTEYGQWDITTSACRNTVLDELKAACDRHGLKLGLYFSQYWDWEGVGGFGLEKNNKWTSTDPYTVEQHTAYCEQAVKQIGEMIEKYQPYLLWYDPGENVGDAYKSIFRAGETNYPQVITNDRLGYGRDYGDFGTGERTIYTKNRLDYGEACFTLNDTWGYSVNNETKAKYYSAEKVLKQFMLYTISYGQNCVLNIGPKPDGSISALTMSLLEQVKAFVQRYAGGGFGNYTRMNTLCRPQWGYMIGLPGNKVMCYIAAKNNTGYENIVIDGIDTTGLSEQGVHILTNENGNAAFEILDDYRVRITGMTLDENTNIGVVELQYADTPKIVDAFIALPDTSIPARVVPIDSTGLTYDFATCNITLPANHSYTSQFIWGAETVNAHMTLEGTPASGSASMTTTWTITDKKAGVVQNVSATENALSTQGTVLLERGKKYLLELKLSGTMPGAFTMSGFRFVTIDSSVPVDSIKFNTTEINGIEGQSFVLEPTILPADATNRRYTITSDNEAVATIDSNTGVVTLPIGADGTATITATTEDGSHVATCTVTAVPEHSDYLFEAESLDGSDEQGVNTGITLFDSEHTNWTLFGFAQKAVNDGQIDNNATLYQIVTNASAWIGMRIDADNNNYPRTSAPYAAMLPRINVTGENYINPNSGANTTSKQIVDPTGTVHPVCFSRNGSVYKYSIDGINWSVINGVSAGTITSRLSTAPLTVACDYKRSSGTMTDTKYRRLITNDPVCVALNYTSEYPFPKKYLDYDASRHLGDVIGVTAG